MAKVGRPSKYDPKFINEVDEYLATCGREQTKLPKKYEFASFIGCDDTTLDEWAKKYPEFSDCRVLIPKSYLWPDFLKRSNLRNLVARVRVFRFLSILSLLH